LPLLLAPFRWLLSSILRVAIFAGLLLVLYLALLKPAIDSGEARVHHYLEALEKKADPKRLAHCLSRADGDVHKMQRCARIF
jgi:hypothetical protein